MASSETHATTYPNWMRWTALVWFVTWLPSYWRTWGVANFLHLCDTAVILTCVGIWTDSALLISSQAVGILVIDAAWTIDAASRVFFGRALVPGNEYLLDPRYPAWVRLLTLFHLVMPALLLWGIYRTGYDRRGWALQSAIALPVIALARFTPPAVNINFAFSDPFFHRRLGPPALHILIVWLFLVFVVYLPTHLVLKRLFRSPETNR
ncbi:MAG TPA: hypothetical protein VEJ45_07250 [Candidatus Acidoferrales bacterium]|nr:hypothetical protein [Candidatus Acidoferrales bacterium]